MMDIIVFVFFFPNDWSLFTVVDDVNEFNVAAFQCLLGKKSLAGKAFFKVYMLIVAETVLWSYMIVKTSSSFFFFFKFM